MLLEPAFRVYDVLCLALGGVHNETREALAAVGVTARSSV